MSMQQDYIYDLSIKINRTLNKVTTILFDSEVGSQQTEVLDMIRGAEAIFFAGSIYVYTGVFVFDAMNNRG